MKISPVTVYRIDWFRLMSELKRGGWSLRAMAAATRISKPVLVGLRNSGAEPKHVAGEALIELWCRVTGLGREQLPMSNDEFKPRRVMPDADWEGGQISCPLCGTAHNVRHNRSEAAANLSAMTPPVSQLTLLS